MHRLSYEPAHFIKPCIHIGIIYTEKLLTSNYVSVTPGSTRLEGNIQLKFGDAILANRVTGKIVILPANGTSISITCAFGDALTVAKA